MEGWTGIPADILATVMGLVNLPDRARMSAVCKAWRLVAIDSNRRPPPPLPSLWILLPHGCDVAAAEAPASLEFSIFSESMGWHAIGLTPGLRYRDCIGSTEGWLMVVDEFGGLHAVDPLREERVHLLSAGSSVEGNSAAVAAATFVHGYRKAIILPHEESNRRSSVVAVVLRQRNLNWRELMWVESRKGNSQIRLEKLLRIDDIEDMAAHDGKLYVLRSDSSLMVVDLGIGTCSSTSSMSIIQTKPDRRGFQRKLLGVMEGDLVMLLWTYSKPCAVRLRRCIPEYKAFRLQTEPEPKWVELKDLRRHAILLGKDGITVPCTREFPELRSNCIYSLVRAEDDGSGGSALEMVDLLNGGVAVEPLIETGAAPIWFQPSGISSAMWLNRRFAKPFVFS